ncbi:cation:proton antiporter [Desulfovibrio litoralis]|uniref:Kef-type potassium/proton antiporter, CPA2 family n=1 Tax=Desulfovibrio litoralis DSM 11393 TaxID=1121455 RepID=A0A1M7TIX9_9BACT|nr:cation:proton antiporter [Desulfovibrio litoralis]SHN70685.1 Kef-type potassium/proton antiporter, CPA2 family [Desulfovibrio litoralis DSM 11393]
MEIPLLRELVVIFLLSIVVISVCHKLKIPPIVAFLITGVACGPFGFGFVNAVHQVEILAEIGVVFLLFSIGMELSISELIRLRKPVFIGGTGQVFLTIVLFAFIATFYVSIEKSIFFGFLVALSSTAIVLKIFQQNAQMDSPHGRMSLSILIYQDLIIVPMMLAVPFLAGVSEKVSWDLLLKGFGYLSLLVTMFLVSRKVVPWILHKVLRTRSRELFLITILGICLSVAFLTSSMGLSLSLGAFLAGLIISESEYSHSALEGILPFRDVFTSLFFISVGMLLNVQFFLGHLVDVGFLVTIIIFGKTIIILLVVLALKYPLRPAIITGLSLAQIGEFSFVLAKAGLDQKLISGDGYQVFLAASILTMVATPFLITAAPKIALAVNNLFSKSQNKDSESPDNSCLTENTQKQDLNNHLIIIGFGIGGKHLARVAKLSGIPYIILEMNPDTVRFFSQQGEPIYHGDATHEAVLDFLGIKNARVLAIVISDPSAVRGITATARKMSQNLHILVRTRFLNEVLPLKEAGASDVIPEEFETSIEIFSRVLSHYLIPRQNIEHMVSEIRSENYNMLRSLDINGASLSNITKDLDHIDINALRVEQGSELIGKSLKESDLRNRFGINIVAIKRNEQLEANPTPDYVFEANDMAYILAEQPQLINATPVFMAPKD